MSTKIKSFFKSILDFMIEAGERRAAYLAKTSRFMEKS